MVLVLSSIIMFIHKQYKIYTHWEKTSGIITNVKIVDAMEQIVFYKYILYNLEYEGVYKQNFDKKTNIGNKIDLVYNKNNFELSLRKIPFQYEDYLMLLISVAGGLYLYFYSCENCDCESPSETPLSIVSNKVTKSGINYGSLKN